MPVSSPTSSHVVDLSVTLSEHLPCSWPGHMPYAHKNWSWFEEAALPNGGSCCSLGPYHTNFLVIDEHCGTHCDGPTHFIPPPSSDLPWAGANGDLGGEQLDLADLTGPAAVVDARGLAEIEEPGVSPVVDRAALERWRVSTAPSGQVRSCCCGRDGPPTTCGERPGANSSSIRSSPLLPRAGRHSLPMRRSTSTSGG